MRHPVATIYHVVNVGLALLTLKGPFGGLRVETFILVVPSLVAIWSFFRPYLLLRVLVGIWCLLVGLVGFKLMLGWSTFDLMQIGVGAWFVAGTIVTAMALFDGSPRKSDEHEASPPSADQPNL